MDPKAGTHPALRGGFTVVWAAGPTAERSVRGPGDNDIRIGARFGPLPNNPSPPLGQKLACLSEHARKADGKPAVNARDVVGFHKGPKVTVLEDEFIWI
jgi:hypothetical protein